MTTYAESVDYIITSPDAAEALGHMLVAAFQSGEPLTIGIRPARIERALAAEDTDKEQVDVRIGLIAKGKLSGQVYATGVWAKPGQLVETTTDTMSIDTGGIDAGGQALFTRLEDQRPVLRLIVNRGLSASSADSVA